MASQLSIEHPPKLSTPSQTLTGQSPDSPAPSCVSMTSQLSLEHPPNLSTPSQTLGYSNHQMQKGPNQPMDDVPQGVKGIHKANKNKKTQIVKEGHKASMKNKYESLCEGIKLQKNQALLNTIYTQLYIMEGERGGVNEEHEVSQMEKNPKTQNLRDTPIECNDIFNFFPEPGHKTKKKMKLEIKTVLTKGIAGIGKTVSVQKFILDWVEGKANQDVDFMFVLPFQELNLIRDKQYSLHKLLLYFYPELQDLDSNIYDECKVVFIFDGLDESRITLMFSDNQNISNVTETSSVGGLITNLIKGVMIPSALTWITSRPAAANQIPSEYINRVTEIHGFTDHQKEEYFRKRISDQNQANKIISHIKKARSLHIMFHMPVFCWISATVLQNILKDHSAEIPKTLTEMYIQFLHIQINMRNQKYERDPDKLLQSNCREIIVKLAELAFKQLMKSNVIFYEEYLRECGIDVNEASVNFGICTEIFKEETAIHQRLDHGEPSMIRPGLQKYACYLTLDPNTANPHLNLSEKNRKVTYVENENSYPDHPERFDYWHQVMSVESLTGRCYWEVEWSGVKEYISVMYKGISRKGASKDCYFGSNEKSWTLNCSNSTFSVCHNDKETIVPVHSPPSNRVGVFLDWSAGTLSFYSISNTHTLTHLHTFTSSFTEPLYARLGTYESVSLL